MLLCGQVNNKRGVYVMKSKNIVLFIFSLFMCCTAIAQHTFSIVAVDAQTGEIGSAGATCISGDEGVIVITDIVLGMGAIHTQSRYSPTNQSNARLRMLAGDTPQQIIDWLSTPANDVQNDPSQRQYNVVSLNAGSPLSAAFTGANTFAESIDVTGANYAIAGNILISEDVVTDMETAFNNTNGSLSVKLMAALQGAKRVGADSRCESLGTSSASAFIRVANSCDTDSSLGNLSMDLHVWLPIGGGEIFEPIDRLQTAFDEHSFDGTCVGGGANDITMNLSENRAGNKIKVTWSDATTNKVDIFRDGVFFKRTRNDGAWADKNATAGVTYTYKVCNKSSTTFCSNIDSYTL